jgi:dehydrogenase/reductase SDR family member 12
MRLHETRLVSRPIQEVFDYTADFANIADWDPGVVSSHRVGAGPVGVGASYDLQVRFGSSVGPMVYEITVYEPPGRVVIVGKGDKVDAVDEIRFERADGKTRIDYTADLEFKGLMRWLVPFAGGTLRKVGERALDDLAKVLEG